MEPGRRPKTITSRLLARRIGMGFKMGIELNNDVTGSGYRWEDLEGEEVIVQAGDDEVSGHGYKWKSAGTEDDVSGHGYKWIRLDVDDTQGHGYKWQELTGETVTIKLPGDKQETQGRVRQVELDDDVSGHGYKW
jgi:hypothetical protein